MRYTCVIGVGALAAILSGCSGAGAPALPTSDPASRPLEAAPLGSAGPGIALAGILNVSDHGATVTYEPIRSTAAVGDDMAIDATGFFTADPCTDCMSITGYGLDPANNLLNLDVTIRHPFPSTATRADLDVFDPRVIFVAGPEPEWEFTEFLSIGKYPRPDGDGGFIDTPISGNIKSVKGADGYTTHFDERADDLAGSTLSGNLNPFKNYAVTLFPNDSASGLNPNRRLAQWRAPEYQTFAINLPPTLESFRAVLILEVSYGQSATKLNRLTPTYFLPQFNRKEAYSVTADPPTVSAGRQYGSVVSVSVAVEDWQQNAPLDPLYPDLGNTGGLKSPSSVTEVRVAIPGWSSSAAIASTPTSGTGAPGAPLIYDLALARDSAFPPNPTDSPVAIIAVRDQLDGNPLGNINPAFDLGATFDATAYQLVEFPLGGNLRLLPASPQLLMHDTTLTVRPAPYASSFEGTSGTEPVYRNGAAGLFSADHEDFRLLLADAPGGFTYYDPVQGAKEPYAAGVFPYDDYPNSPGAHPNPDVTMPVLNFSANPSGNMLAVFGDDNFTIDPLRFSTDLTDPSPNSIVVAAWQMLGGVATLGPRLSDGAGSAPGPTLGGKARLSIANDDNVSIGRWNNLLGWVSAGVNSEAYGTYSQLRYYGAPYASESDRMLTCDVLPVAQNLYGPSPTETNFRALAKTVAVGSDGSVGEWPHFATNGNRIVRFNAFLNYNPTTRTAAATGIGAVFTAPLLNTIVGMAYCPFESRAPFVVGNTVQTHDWLLVMTRESLSGHTLRAFNTGSPWAQEAAQLGNADGWGSAIPLISDMDFDPVNRLLVLTYDSNGVSAGGNILTSVLTPQ